MALSGLSGEWGHAAWWHTQHLTVLHSKGPPTNRQGKAPRTPGMHACWLVAWVACMTPSKPPPRVLAGAAGKQVLVVGTLHPCRVLLLCWCVRRRQDMEEAIAGKNKGMIKDREVCSSIRGRAVYSGLSGYDLRRGTCVLAVTALGGSCAAGDEHKERAADSQRVVCCVVCFLCCCRSASRRPSRKARDR